MATAPAPHASSTALPPPTGRVFLSAQWRALAMLNWQVEPRLIEPYVPRGTELDFHDGKTYVSLVGFVFRDTYLLGLPIPWHRNFEEVNLRFYVRREERGDTKRAVCFIREIVERWAIARIARWSYNESYVCHPMRHRHEGYSCDLAQPHGDRVLAEYEWNCTGNWLSLGVECRGQCEPLAPGSHAEFIAEHYWGYCRQRDGGTVEYRVEHPPWHVWPAERSWVSAGVADFYPPEFRKLLSQPPDTAFLADGSAVRVYQPRRIA
ncbi:MAG TPA: DUF2071 domain-containing protein [Pirellulaceae bacterium]|nr:DUF2071 domain-containing protein [Pirellulaceae bacterium]